jgi:6-pyruvoyltetrahydropterin/6-carboxytetrahydropterin synthase
MITTVTRKYTIDMGHRVEGQGGKCENPHGHSWTIHFACSAHDLNAIGMILDYGIIKEKLCGWLDEYWDHRFLVKHDDPWGKPLKDIAGFVFVPFNPTSENIAQYLLTQIGPVMLEGTGCWLSMVTVDETANCSASVTLSQ